MYDKITTIQKSNIERLTEILKKHNGALLWETVGCGKTRQALKTAQQLHEQGHIDKIIIICPKTLLIKKTWEEEMRNIQVQIPFEVYNYEQAKKIDRQQQRSLIILDEAHKIKNPRAKMSLYIYSINKGYTLAITGTPMKTSPEDLFGILKGTFSWDILKTLGIENFTKYKKKCCVYDYINIGNTMFGRRIPRINHERHTKFLHELVAKLKTDFGIIKEKGMKEEIHKTLPKKTSHQIDVKIDYSEEEKQEKQRILVSLNLAEYQDDTRALNDTKVQYCRLRQIIGVRKATQSIPIINKLHEKHKHLIVFTHHQEALEALRAGGLADEKIDGQTKSKDRERILREFDESENGTLLATIGTCNTGLTLVNCNAIVFVETSYSPAEMEQAEARIYRIGQKTAVHIYTIHDPDNDIEERIRTLVSLKDKSIKKII